MAAPLHLVMLSMQIDVILFVQVLDVCICYQNWVT